jgi:hypothetical protein
VQLVLAVLAFDLTRAAAILAGMTMAKAITATIRRELVHVPARDRVLGPAPVPAPAQRGALATSVDHAGQRALRTPTVTTT